MSEYKNTVSFKETTEVLEALFKYIRNIRPDCNLEYLTEKSPSLCLKRIGTAFKTKQNIIGGYDAELPFIIYHKANINDTRSIIDITIPFDELAYSFEEEKFNNFPNLNLPDGCIPVSLEMVETPEDASGKENNEAVFMAMFKFTYRRKSKI